MSNPNFKDRLINALFSLLLGSTLGLGMLLVFVVICQGEDVTASTVPPPLPRTEPSCVSEWRTLDQQGLETVESVAVVDVATATVAPTQSLTLMTIKPLTTTIHVPAGAVTAPLTLTLSSLAVPSFPPTPPWVVWGGRAFSLTAQREGQVVGSGALSTPLTVTVDFYGAQEYRWMLMHWVSPTWEIARCAGQMGVVGVDRIEQVVCNGLGEYTIAAAPDTWYLPIIRR